MHWNSKSNRKSPRRNISGLCEVDNPARLDFGVVALDREYRDGDEKKAGEERPRARTKGGRPKVDWSVAIAQDAPTYSLSTVPFPLSLLTPFLPFRIFLAQCVFWNIYVFRSGLRDLHRPVIRPLTSLRVGRRWQWQRFSPFVGSRSPLSEIPASILLTTRD